MGRLSDSTLDLEQPQANCGIFAENAEKLLALGLVPLPIGRNKKPVIAGFGDWKNRPTKSTVAKFANKYPDTNVAILTGLSHVKVVDADSPDALKEAIRIWGDTPLKVRTQRGGHLYYRDDGKTGSRNLRKSHGLEIDIKGGSGYAVAPPSVNANGIPYEHMEGGWPDLPRLPNFRPDALPSGKSSKTDSKLTKPMQVTSLAPTAGIREGQRWDYLRREVCKFGGSPNCHSFEEMLRQAHNINSAFLPPLQDHEVIKLAADTWDAFQSGRLRKMAGSRGVVMLSDEAMSWFQRNSRFGGSSLVMLERLKVQHWARVQEGRTFSLSAEKVWTDKIMGPLGRDVIANMIKELVTLGALILDSKHYYSRSQKQWYAAEYTFGEINYTEDESETD